MRGWLIRLAALVGLAPASIDEDAVSFWRTLGIGLGGIVLALGILCRLVLWTSWETALHPEFNRLLEGSSTHAVISRVLPRGADGDPTHPYAFWASDRRKFTFAVNPHASVGQTITERWDHGGWLVWVRVHHRDLRVPYGFPLAVLAAIAGSVGLWLLVVLCSARCFLLSQRIARDLVGEAETRSIRVAEVWWPRKQLAAVPVFVSDEDTDTRRIMYAPAVLAGRLGDGPVTVAVFPHTGLIQRVAASHGKPVQISGMHWRLIDRSRWARALWLPALSPVALRLRYLVTRFQLALSVFLLLAGWAAVPALMPLSMPRYSADGTVVSVVRPYTTEPTDYPYEVTTQYRRYYFTRNPHLHAGDHLTAQFTIFDQFIDVDRAGVVSRNDALQNHPSSVLVLLASTALYFVYALRGFLARRREAAEAPASAVAGASRLG